MFTPVAEYTMLDNIESYLAAWTGKLDWPCTEAVFEKQAVIPAPDLEGDFASSFALFTYEVSGVAFTASIRQTAGKQERPNHVGDLVEIRYKPDHPATYYYAPACQLANRLVVAVVIVSAVLCVYLFA